MTREEMVKRHWKPYMAVDYQDKGMQFPAQCLLSAIDFDAEILTLTPMDGHYQEVEFKAALQFCSIPKRMKPIAINGKKVVDISENIIKAKKFP